MAEHDLPDDVAGEALGGLHVATAGARFGGFVVDGLVTGAMFVAIHLGAGKDLDDTGWVSIVTLVATIAYEVVGVAVWGRTVGKVAARTRVADAAGANPQYLPALVRAIVPALPAAVATAVGLDVLGLAATVAVYAPILSDPDRRGIHDRAAGTLVVATR